MRVINRNNKTYYKYDKHTFSDGVVKAIILFSVSILLFIFAIVFSYIFMGEASMTIAGIGIASLLFDIGSLIIVILEIYLYKNYHKEIRNLLILQILFLVLWILIT